MDPIQPNIWSWSRLSNTAICLVIELAIQYSHKFGHGAGSQIQSYIWSWSWLSNRAIDLVMEQGIR